MINDHFKTFGFINYIVANSKPFQSYGNPNKNWFTLKTSQQQVGTEGVLHLLTRSTFHMAKRQNI